MIFNGKAETESAARRDILPVTFDFDWGDKCYRMRDGSPEELDGVDGVKAWLSQCLRTRRGAYPIYPADYGCSALDLVGTKLHGGEALSVLEKELQEAAKYCEEITSIGNARFNEDGTVSVDVTIKTENGLVQEVTVLDKH